MDSNFVQLQGYILQLNKITLHGVFYHENLSKNLRASIES